MALTSGEYEAQANRLRSQMGETADELRSNLKPSNLASEAASRVGVSELSWRGALDFVSSRHPGPTAIAGFGVALWLLAAARKRNKEGVHEVTLPLRESSSSLVDTATRVFRERAATKQREFIGAAQTHVAKGAAMLSDAIEQKLEDVIDRVTGGSQVRPLIRTTSGRALATALETLLERRPRRTSRSNMRRTVSAAVAELRHVHMSHVAGLLSAYSRLRHDECFDAANTLDRLETGGCVFSTCRVDRLVRDVSSFATGP
jgi:hypothetical protein